MRAEKGFSLFILNEDMNHIKIIKSLEDSGVLIDGVAETVKDEIKKTRRQISWSFLAPLAASLVQPVISSVVKGTSGRGVRKAGRGYMNKKFLVLLHLLKNIKITNYFNYEHRFNSIFSRNNLHRIEDGAYVINLDDKNSQGKHLGFIIY